MALTKHIDVFALLVIVLGLLAFAKGPEIRFFPNVSAAGFRVHNAIQRTGVCPLSEALMPRFR